jgi:vacuolar protein sorting-associated protein 13D
VVSSFAADREYEDNRRRRKVRNGDEFGTVVDGLAYGVLGGVTSIADQTYKGVKRDGATGFFSGFGKGVMGTIIKVVFVFNS